MKEWKTHKSGESYSHPFMKILAEEVELPNGIVIPDYTVWKSGNVAQVLPITVDGRAVLVRMFKQGAQRMIYECPGGFINDDEDPLIAAKRELAEETNFVSNDWEKIHVFYHHPSKERGETHFFLARNAFLDTENGHAQDATEEIEIVLLSFSELMSLIMSGEIIQTGTIAGVLLALQIHEELWQKNR